MTNFTHRAIALATVAALAAAGSGVVASAAGAQPVRSAAPTTSFAVTPNPYTFPRTLPGATSRHVFTVTNTGTTSQTFGSAPASIGLGAGGFSINSDTCAGATLGAGQTCKVGVQFQGATTMGIGWLKVVNAQGVDENASLYANDAPFTISPSSISFGNVSVGSSSPTQTLTITNTDNSPHKVWTVMNYAQANQFTITGNTCDGATLYPSYTCQVTVDYSPTAAGAATTHVWATDINPQSVPGLLNADGSGPFYLPYASLSGTGVSA